MLKKMLAMLPTGLLLAVGCSSKTEPAPGETERPAPSANARQVTLLVAGMIERQNIT